MLGIRCVVAALLVVFAQSGAFAVDAGGRRKGAVERALKAFASAVGCNFLHDPRNTISYDVDADGGADDVALIQLDAGCLGGSATTSSQFVVINSGADGRKYVRADISMPMTHAENWPTFVKRIELTPDGIQYSGFMFGGKDPSCCPSIPAKGVLRLVKNNHPVKALQDPVYSWVAIETR